MQVGGALGVAILGTTLNFRFQHLMAHALAHVSVPLSVRRLIESSIGNALAIARRAPTNQGSMLRMLARQAFVSGMDEALMIASVVVGVAAMVVLVLLPNRGVAVLEPELNQSP
jgi:multisubunit Na+/H+ antiporter MnhC subunit